MIYHTEFGQKSKGKSESRGSRQKFGQGATPRKPAPLLEYYHAKFGHFRSNGITTCQKFDSGDPSPERSVQNLTTWSESTLKILVTVRRPSTLLSSSPQTRTNEPTITIAHCAPLSGTIIPHHHRHPHRRY